MIPRAVSPLAPAWCLTGLVVLAPSMNAQASELLRWPALPAAGARQPPPPEGAEQPTEPPPPAAPLVVIEGACFFKPAVSVAFLPSGLVDATTELDRAIQEARPLLGPELGAELPPSTQLPDEVFVSTNTLRLWSTAHLFERVDVSAAWQAAAVVASSPLFTPGATGVLGASATAPQRRLIDFDPVLVAEGGFALQHNLDQLAISMHTSSVSVVLGRQVVSWGTGHLWNPTDLFSPFAPTDVDREVRRGADAARVSIALGTTTELELLWLPQLRLADNGGVVRGRTNLLAVDLSLTLAKYVGDVVIGADAATDVGPFGIYAEGAWTQPLALAIAFGDIGAIRVADGFARIVAGASCRPTEAWSLIVEATYNGFGAASASELVTKMKSSRIARGEIFGAGRAYLGIASAWQPTDLVTLSGTAIVNLTDPSVLSVLAAELSVSQDVMLRVGATAPIGLGVDLAGFRALRGSDVVDNTRLFQRTTRTLGAQSEYGLSPASLFLQLGAYFG